MGIIVKMEYGPRLDTRIVSVLNVPSLIIVLWSYKKIPLFLGKKHMEVLRGKGV
jgi:hypothetical protein